MTTLRMSIFISPPGGTRQGREDPALSLLAVWSRGQDLNL
jgi:hypothetical protein